MVSHRSFIYAILNNFSQPGKGRLAVTSSKEVTMEARELVKDGEDWEVVKRFLPAGWEERAREWGAPRRLRGFASAEMLSRGLLIHLAQGCSARETVVRARLGGLAQVSDVARLKRLRAAGEWLRWMAEQVMGNWLWVKPAAVFGSGMRVRVLDATTVQEPGVTGSIWRLRYSVRLPSLQCDEAHLTAQGVGERFQRFAVRTGERVVADRGYAHPEGQGDLQAARRHLRERAGAPPRSQAIPGARDAQGQGHRALACTRPPLAAPARSRPAADAGGLTGGEGAYPSPYPTPRAPAIRCGEPHCFRRQIGCLHRPRA
jgi:hypothetical protein